MGPGFGERSVAEGSVQLGQPLFASAGSGQGVVQRPVEDTRTTKEPRGPSRISSGIQAGQLIEPGRLDMLDTMAAAAAKKKATS